MKLLKIFLLIIAFSALSRYTLRRHGGEKQRNGFYNFDG